MTGTRLRLAGALLVAALSASGVATAAAQPDSTPAPQPATSSSPTPLASPLTADAVDIAVESQAAPELVTSQMPVVPVTGFWSREDRLKRARLRQALVEGELKGYRRVLVQQEIADALAEELAIELHPDVRRVGIDRLRKAVAKCGLGLVAATEVGPSMRALALNGASLTGVDRVTSVEDWPLSVPMETTADAVWRQDATWVLVAGGDSFTDRGVYDTVVRKGKGVDFPFDGGTARVTGRGCCDPVFNDNIVPRYVLTGNRGAVRRLFQGAELAVANHEQPVTESATFHSSGTRFSGKPALTRIFTRAGIDFLSLANNHIGDYGADGIRDTRRILRQYDIAFGGAGKDLDQARKVRFLEAAGTQVAIMPCLDIVRVSCDADRTAGATPCVDEYIRKDIR